MKSPHLYLPRHRSRAEIEASFVPCCYCGEKERLTPEGVYKISHRYELHPGMEKRRERMSTEDLLSRDCGAAFGQNPEKLSGVSEARIEK